MRLEKPPGGPGAREEAPAGWSGVGVVGTQTSVRTVGNGPLVTREQAEARAPAAFGGAAFSGHTWRAHLCRREGWASALCTGSSPCCWPQVWNATLEMTPRGPTHTQGTGRGRACPVQGPGERWPASVRPGSKLAAPSPAMTCVAVPGPSARGPAWRPRVPTALVGRPPPPLLLSRPTHDSSPGYGLEARTGSRAGPGSAHPLSRPLCPLPPVRTCLPHVPEPRPALGFCGLSLPFPGSLGLSGRTAEAGLLEETLRVHASSPGGVCAVHMSETVPCSWAPRTGDPRASKGPLQGRRLELQWAQPFRASVPGGWRAPTTRPQCLPPSATDPRPARLGCRHECGPSQRRSWGPP